MISLRFNDAPAAHDWASHFVISGASRRHFVIFERKAV
jgi:hypothetical protein